MTTNVEISRTLDRAPTGGVVRRCLMGIRLYLNKRRERLALSCLSDDALRDIGLDGGQQIMFLGIAAAIF